VRNTYLWLLQLVTGGLILLFGGTHMVLMHLDDILGFFGIDIGEPTTWASMMDRAGRGFWLAFYIIFLALVLYHGLNGLRGIILELTPSPRMERLVTGLILALGIIAFGLGIYVPAQLFAG
jgi:succinate dehydrogenase / fumarate reductase membrane anchor subunit